MNASPSNAHPVPRWLKREGLAIAVLVFLALNVFVVVHYGFGGAARGAVSTHRLR